MLDTSPSDPAAVLADVLRATRGDSFTQEPGDAAPVGERHTPDGHGRGKGGNEHAETGRVMYQDISDSSASIEL